MFTFLNKAQVQEPLTAVNIAQIVDGTRKVGVTQNELQLILTQPRALNFEQTATGSTTVLSGFLGNNHYVWWKSCSACGGSVATTLPNLVEF